MQGTSRIQRRRQEAGWQTTNKQKQTTVKRCQGTTKDSRGWVVLFKLESVWFRGLLKVSSCNKFDGMLLHQKTKNKKNKFCMSQERTIKPLTITFNVVQLSCPVLIIWHAKQCMRYSLQEPYKACVYAVSCRRNDGENLTHFSNSYRFTNLIKINFLSN